MDKYVHISQEQLTLRYYLKRFALKVVQKIFSKNKFTVYQARMKSVSELSNSVLCRLYLKNIEKIET